MAEAHNWQVGERVRFDDGYERADGTVADIAKLGSEQHLSIVWDDGTKDRVMWKGSNPDFSPLPAAVRV